MLALVMGGGGRLGLLPAGSLVGLVMADRATRGSAEHAMVPGHVPGDAANCGTLDAASGIRLRRSGQQGDARHGSG